MTKRSRKPFRVPWPLAAMPLVVACAFGLLSSAWAWPPEKPYDPRPLTEEVAQKLTEDKFSFVVMGDSTHSRVMFDLVKLAEKLKPTLALLTGDIAGTGSTKCYDHIEYQLGPFMRKIPTWPTVGNHELGRLEGWGLYKQFYNIKSWEYSFDFRNARFIQIGAPGAFHEKEWKMKWLEAQLAEGRKAGKHLFVWQHCPAYTVGYKRKGEVPGVPTAFTRLCTKYGVVADFAGHEHVYYRTFRDGVTYIIQGLGGEQIRPLNRRGEAIAGDVYYGALPGREGGTVLHTPKGERKFGGGVFMLTQIQVDGQNVTGKTYSSTGEVMDEFVLVPRPTTQPAKDAEAQSAEEPKPAEKAAPDAKGAESSEPEPADKL